MEVESCEGDIKVKDGGGELRGGILGSGVEVWS